MTDKINLRIWRDFQSPKLQTCSAWGVVWRNGERALPNTDQRAYTISVQTSVWELWEVKIWLALDQTMIKYIELFSKLICHCFGVSSSNHERRTFSPALLLPCFFFQRFMKGQNLAEDVGGALLTLAFSHSGEDGLVSVFWWQVGWAFVVF